MFALVETTEDWNGGASGSICGRLGLVESWRNKFMEAFLAKSVKWGKEALTKC